MLRPELRMTFSDEAALSGEFESNLKHGRAFVPGAFVIEVLADCVLVLVHPTGGNELALVGQAVFVSDSAQSCGVGVELRPFDATILGLLAAFVHEPPTTQADAELTSLPSAAPSPLVEERHPSEHPSEHADAAQDDDTLGADLQVSPARHEQLRSINQTEQQRIARSGELNDRVILERLYGKTVWEGLLRNPRLTPPEVARIARKGTLPRPLIDVILDQGAWIQSPLVRRALLGNPRLSGEGIMKLLRITPKHELRLIHKTVTYSNQVREAARKVLDL